MANVGIVVNVDVFLVGMLFLLSVVIVTLP